MKTNVGSIKVNILTGLLGAGKTTLISKIIKLPELKERVVLIQNDFAEEMGIEKEALKDSDGNSLGDIVELPNGCLCCAVKDNVVLFIERLITKKKNIDIVLIEAHGLSDISELVKKFWLDKELESPITLNSIVCLVDSYYYYKNLGEFEKIFLSQILISDKLVLNKTDLVSNEDMQKIKESVSSLNPLGKITLTKFSDVDLNYFLEDLKIYDTTLNYNEKQLISTTSSHEHDGETVSYLKTDENESVIENLVINLDQVQNREEIDKIIGAILWIHSEEHDYSIIRFKGIKYLDSERFLMIQGIYDLYEIEELKISDAKSEENNDKRSKLLLIGKKLKKNGDFLTKLFNPK